MKNETETIARYIYTRSKRGEIVNAFLGTLFNLETELHHMTVERLYTAECMEKELASAVLYCHVMQLELGMKDGTLLRHMRGMMEELKAELGEIERKCGDEK